MTNKLKKEISSIMDRAAMVSLDSYIINKLLSYMQISAYLISKGRIDEATNWLCMATDNDPDFNIFDDLKDSEGSPKDINDWINKQLEGEIGNDEYLKLIRKHYPELEKLRTA
ncbi:TPA: hypothetical protein ACS727_003664 [Providencia alcalifaciens]|uniref:hypothetical protein n=1 Tax=Providencia alcalifaciens TaxID=126385 RepID=UPI00044EE9EE|nr:hypothetical protein [Providencia alcalifaciens]ETT05679.1 hypothetical protein HMPREF1562_0024 [Providencia alcalifaciens F90-2004]CAG9418315.1 hypothetical protein NVI2019_NGLDDFDA_01609 [Providencia alcalifaciens]